MKYSKNLNLIYGISIALSFALILSSCGGTKPIVEDEDNPVPEISITLDHEDFSLYIGHSEKILAESSIPGLNITWSSSDNSVARVDNDGVVYGISEGFVEVKAFVSNIASSSVFVEVCEYVEPINEYPTIEILEGYEELSIFNTLDSKEIDLTEGLIAKDYLGNTLKIEIIDDGGFSS